MKVGRNERCPCGSGKKFKRCCQRKQGETRAAEATKAAGEEPLRHREDVPVGEDERNGRKRDAELAPDPALTAASTGR